jgi:hypothetical protein
MRFTLICLFCCLLARPVAAQDFVFNRDCAKWLEQKGYSRDYIELKVGKRQPGWPETWRGNVAPKNIQPGDVAMYLVPEKGQATRVAYVEEVRRNPDGGAGAIVVSEWNYGPYLDERCFVSDHFGRLSVSKPITVDALVKVWRPSLPLEPAPAKPKQ